MKDGQSVNDMFLNNANSSK